MEPKTASQFVSSLVQCIQAFCHGYVQFSSSIEIVGHICLNVDKGSKFNYIVNEEVSRNPGNFTTAYHTNSYHSLPPTKQMLLKTSIHCDSKENLVSGSTGVQNSVSSADTISSSLPSSDKTSVAYPVNIIRNNRGWTDRPAEHSHKRPSNDFHQNSPQGLPGSKPFQKRSKVSKNPEEQEHVSSTLDPDIVIKRDPDVVVKRDPDISFPHNRFIVKNMSNGKEHVIEEESFTSDEPCEDKVRGKASSSLYIVPTPTRQESTDLENLTIITSINESTGSETSGIHPTKSLPIQIRHQIVEYADIVGNRPAARHFGVHESSIRHWRKKFGMVLHGTGGKRGRKRKDDYFQEKRTDDSFQDLRDVEVNASSLKVEEIDQP